MRLLTTTAATTCLTALVLSGCTIQFGGARENRSAQTGTSAGPRQEAAPHTPTQHAPGNFKGTGETAALYRPDGTMLAQFTVTDIQADVRCTNPQALSPVNGTFVAVTMDIETTNSLAWEHHPFVEVTAHAFAVIGTDETSDSDVVGNGPTCLFEHEQLPGAGVDPGQAVTGKVVLDTRHSSGTIVFTQPHEPDTHWYWDF